jgi:hypothetical protein
MVVTKLVGNNGTEEAIASVNGSLTVFMQSLIAGIKPMSSSWTIVSIQKSWTNQNLPEDCRITMLRRLFTVYSVGLPFLTSEDGSVLNMNPIKRLFHQNHMTSSVRYNSLRVLKLTVEDSGEVVGSSICLC